MAVHTILGANGTIAAELIPVLQAHQHQVRLVSRNPRPVPGAETFAANMLDAEEVKAAVKGSAVVYLVVGITYDAKIWARDWPVIMRNVIDAVKAAGARLLFFDDVYMYGKVDGIMTEETPYRPSSKKGEVRARIARMLQDEMRSGSIKALIARAVDFYGPGVTDKSAASVLVFSNMKKGKKAQWFINADVPRSYTYTPDAAKAFYLLGTKEEAFGQVWHLPCVSPALTGREFVKTAAKYMNTSDKVTVVPGWMLSIMGWFVPFIREVREMNYQDAYPFRFDSSKIEKAFGLRATPYEEGIKATAAWFKSN